MSILKKAIAVLNAVDEEQDFLPDNAAYVYALESKGLLKESPRIIRTLEEVEALDSYALLADKDGGLYNRAGILENVTPENMGKYMPLAVLVARGQFRAAREALEQGNE